MSEDKKPKPRPPVTAYTAELRCGVCNHKMHWPTKDTVACPKLGCENRGVRCKIPMMTLERASPF